MYSSNLKILNAYFLYYVAFQIIVCLKLILKKSKPLFLVLKSSSSKFKLNLFFFVI